MANLQEEQQHKSVETAYTEPTKQQAASSQSLEESLKALSALGGFNFITTTVDGIRELDPGKRAKKDIYLSEEDTKADRIELLKRLEMWAGLIEENESLAQMQEKAKSVSESNLQLLQANQAKALEESKELERVYHGLATFFLNTEQKSIPKLTLINASPAQVADLKDGEVLNLVNQELHDNYEVYDLSNHYSLMVMPGYLQKTTVVDAFARTAHKHKVMMVTDYEDHANAKEAIEYFEKNKLSDAQPHKANLLMSCNWIAGRKAYKELGESEALFLPPSSALAGRMHRVLMSQPVAGTSYGVMMGAEGTRFNIDRNQAGDMNRLGLIPLLSAFGKVQAFSDRTMFNGDNIGMQTYSVVRVFDWINKVLVDFLDRSAFKNWDEIEEPLKRQISKFLNSITGNKKLIKDYEIIHIAPDPDDPKKIDLKINLTPHFAARSFLVSLSGMDGAGPDGWKTDVK